MNTANNLMGMGNALEHRFNPRVTLDANGQRFRGMTLLEMGRTWLNSRGVHTTGLDRMQLAATMLTARTLSDDTLQLLGDLMNRGAGGMVNTSDFGALLGNVLNKRLRDSYTENPGTYRLWARRAPDAPDFRPVSVVNLSAMPDLLKVNESGEFKYGKLSDSAESYSLLTYGRIVAVTRQTLVNDDLRALGRLVEAFGAAAARLENRTVYAQLTANAALSDGTALFHANHGNLATGAGSALQASALATMRAAMRTQRGLQLEELNLTPGYLIGPAALEQTMYQLTSAGYVPATLAAVNEFRAGGRTALMPVVEPVLDAISGTAWYAAAAGGQADTVEYCFLSGADAPVIEQKNSFEIDGLSLKCRHDFAAKAVDFRGLYKAAGA